MNLNIKFRAILLKYYACLNLIKGFFKNKKYSEDVISRMLYINKDWFHGVRTQLFDEEDIFTVITDKRTLNKKCFLLDEKARCPGCEDGKPFKIIKYRNIDIPVYDDDYGQQDFAIIDGKEISGGSYNLFSYTEFINYVDKMLEEKYLKDEYDMKAEIYALYPEWKERQK